MTDRPDVSVRPAPRPVRPGESLTGTIALLRAALRRDRIRLTVWALAIATFYAYFAFALDTLFADPQARAGRAALMQTPAGVVLSGPGYGVADYTTGAALANEGTTWVVLALGLMSIQHVVRHTRAEEDAGHADLIGSAVVGRYAPLAAAMAGLVLHLGVVVVASGAALVLVSGLPVAQVLGLTLGAAVAAAVLGGVALVACQVFGQARPATGTAGAVLGLALVIRAAGDVQEAGGSPLSWLSPIAWAQQMRPFVDLRWWPLAIGSAVLVVLAVAAFALAGRRDLGSGLVQTTRGRAHARPGLRSAWGLARAQQRGPLIGCVIGLGALWFGTGTLLADIGDLMAELAADNPLVGAVFGTDPSRMGQAFLGVMVLYAALCCAAYGIVAAGRPAVEEEGRRAEAVLALPVPRVRWLGASLAAAWVGSTVLLGVSVVALWLGAAVSGASGPTPAEHLGVVVGHLPAVLVFGALTAVLVAWAPRARGAAWGLLVLALVLGLFAGALPEVPAAVAWISPFHWVPVAYVEPVAAGPVLGLTAVVIALTLLAGVGIRRRDIRAG